MKTVIDAVNEFKGEYFDGECGDENHQDEIVVAKKDFSEYKCGDIYIGSGNSIRNEYWKVIGTRDDFNNLVSQMETNFGLCWQRYSYYKASFKGLVADRLMPIESTKELEVMDIDWSKAPEHYDYHLSYKADRSNNGFCCITPNNGYYFLDGYVASNADDWIITPRPQSTLTYTQAMADNGELPSVGMEVMILDEVHKVLLLPDDSRAYVTLYEGEYFFNTIDFMKPLTPPITLIDGECYQFNSPSGGLFKGYYIPVKGLFVAHRGNFDAHLCTNIKPLTVEVK